MQVGQIKFNEEIKLSATSTNITQTYYCSVGSNVSATFTHKNTVVDHLNATSSSLYLCKIANWTQYLFIFLRISQHIIIKFTLDVKT